MADAPEVVPGSLPDNGNPIPDDKFETKDVNTSESSLKSDPRKFEQAEKELSYVNEETSPKHAIESDDRAGSGLEVLKIEKETGQTPLSPDVPPYEEHARAQSRPEEISESDWHHGFWDCCRPSGLWLESLLCPCVLVGRTHTRLHKPDTTHLPTANMYCMSCSSLGLFMIVGAPLFAIMTSGQRREVRYKYHIKGSNGDDCWRSTFCCWCAIIQEEKEVQWQIEKRKKETENRSGMTGREDMMEYKPG
ncbi:PLAC8-domain-containing protein [Rhizodiscina lignyota]|uniref:PLAC8-domain-containing protein n=1 Tax=Rhizodiscina lignyota TaxID=1504668 RepID=A0A9P4MCV1_9PEZI|nr:PLAC8-domain-containing protein [Rhizodiscina lignyota]